MSEDTEPKVVVPKAKGKGGRPRKVTTKLKPNESLHEIVPPKVKRSQFNEWPTRKACKIKIHKSTEEGDETIWQLGDSPILRIRRGVEVIVPWDIKGLLDDTVVDMPRCNMNTTPPTYYTEKFTRFEYSFFGERTWEEYLEFKAGEAKKK